MTPDHLAEIVLCDESRRQREAFESRWLATLSLAGVDKPEAERIAAEASWDAILTISERAVV